MIKFTLIPLLCITAGISRSEDGLFQVEKQKFGVAYWSRDWKSSASQVLKGRVKMILTRPKMSYQQEKTKTFEIGSCNKN